MITGSLPLRGGQLASYRAPSMHLPVNDGEHQLQVLCDLRSSALMHFRDEAARHSARQTRAALSLMRLFVSCARKIAS